MSISRSRNINGHATKRRKTSHDSGEPISKSMIVPEHSNDGAADSGPSDQGDEEALVASPPVPSGQRQHRPQRSNVTMTTTNTSSSTLMLQAQRLLDDTRPDHLSRIKKLMPMADKLIAIIKGMPGQQPMSYAQAQSYSQKTLRVTIPWSHRPATDVKYNFEFVSPTKVTLQGLLMHHLTLRDSSAALIIVPEIPAEVFQEKDYLNYRCLHKRAFYLACIAAAVREGLEEEFNLSFAFPQGNDLSCILQLSTKEDGKLVYEINPSFPETMGPLMKMTPTQTCIRKHDLADNSTDDLSAETPFYNSTVRWLSSSGQLHHFIQETATRADSFRDSCLLAATWLRQRRFSSAVTHGGFGIEEWALTCALLLKSGGHQGQPLFSPRYSAVQFFKAMLQVLSGRDMYDAFIVRGSGRINERSSLPIFLDAATSVNVLYKMTPWSYARLKHFATLSLAMLNSKRSNGFDATFMTRAFDSAIQYDEVYQLHIPSSPSSNSGLIRQQSKAYQILKEGLGDRAHLINIDSEAVSSWKITSSTPKSTPTTHTVGILINADAATRLVDHGPSVDEKEASQAFRSFWGEKAELRKFKDGRISESLVWAADTSVTQQVVHWICQRHLGLSSPEIRTTPPLEHAQLESSVSADEAFTIAMNTFQSLSSTLHHLDGLPLPIRSVAATSEGSRSSSLISPLEPGVAQPIDVVIQFDSSGRWPDNLQAIQYTKIAFLTKIGDLLTKQDRKLEVRVGVESTLTSNSGIFNTSYLDVTNSPSAPSLSPIVFRLRIYHEREMQLVQQNLSDKSLHQHDREQLQAALQYLKRNFIAGPSHNTAIHSLLTQFPPLSTTIRLLKSWVSAHHLSQHIPGEVLELIAANIFLFPAPWSVPGTPTLAFTRCLHLLSRWDWSTQPLITDLSPSQEMTLESRNELEARFAAWRQMDPNMNTVTWFVGTNLDSTDVVWTQGVGGTGSKPPRVIASRLTALASAAINLINSKSETVSTIMTASDWKGIFTSSLDDFDFTIHLKSSVLRGNKKSKKAQFKNLQLAASLDVDTTGVDFVQSYIEDLTSSFGNAAIFFYGAKYSGSDVIGGLWRPNVRGKDAKPWKIRLGYSTVPVKMYQEDSVEANEGVSMVNFEGMLAEMGIMGEGLVEKIAVKEN